MYSNEISLPCEPAPNVKQTATQSVAYDAAPATRFHLLVAIAAAGGQFADGYVLGTIGIALSLATDSLHLGAAWLGALGGASLAGIFIGSLFLAPLADRFGRRPLMIPTMAVFAVISVAQFFVTAPWQLFVLRLLLGLALGIDYVVCCTVVAEFSPTRSRGRLLTLLVFTWTVGYTIAFILGTLLASNIADAWRWILISSAVPSAIVFLFRLAIPESPTWLMQRGRTADARRIVTRHFGERVDLPAVLSTPSQSTRASWAELFSTRYRRRTLVGAVFYTAQVIPYFAVSTFIPIVLSALGISSAYLGGVVFNTFMLIGAGFGLWVIDKITRRQFLLTGFYFTGAILLFIAFVRLEPLPTVIAVAMFAFVMAASTSLIYTYLPELFPTRLRASGVGVGTAISRVGAAMSTFLLPACMELWGIRATLLVCAGVLLIGGVACQAFAPETRGRSIEDV
ncbi:MAG TPA: MFS transporter [Povalibacter sp.]|nr:MFS transporter [Povalibacter sp.]